MRVRVTVRVRVRVRMRRTTLPPGTRCAAPLAVVRSRVRPARYWERSASETWRCRGDIGEIQGRNRGDIDSGLE